MSIQSSYIKIYKDNKQYWEHRYVWEQHNGPIPPKMHIHHINGKKDDNRIENLSLTTCQENNQKRLGKGWVKIGKRYMSQRVVNGKRKHLGMYGTKCGAYMASRMAYV